LAAMFGTLTWGATFLSSAKGFGPMMAGVIMAGFGIAAVIAGPLGGYISDHTKKRKYVITPSTLAYLPFPLLLLAVPTNGFVLALALASVFGFLFNLCGGPMNVLMAEVAGPRLAGSATGLASTFWQAGGAFIPVLMGLAIDVTGAYTYSWLTVALFTVPAAISFWLVKERAHDERALGPMGSR